MVEGGGAVEEILVRLLDEEVDVWRPVHATPLGDDRYLIVAQAYDRATERWQFEPGARVICSHVELSGSSYLAAARLVP